MSLAGVQAWNQLIFERNIHLIQMKFVHLVDNCWKKYTNRWLQLNEINSIHLHEQRYSRGDERLWDGSN